MATSLPGRWGVRTLAVAAALALIPVFSPVAPASAATGCRSTVPGDVNGDGLAEVAVGELGNHGGAGAVHVFYGHKSGLVTKQTGTARNDQYFTQGTPGVPGSGAATDAFGAAVALGDFDHDGCADLAVIAQGDADSITVLYGSTAGITTKGAARFDSDSLGHSFRRLGARLVVADVDHDGVDDLAATAQGTVIVLYGDADGLNRGEAASFLSSDSPEIPDGVGTIGTGLSTGDFNGNKRAELAVGADGADQRGALFTLERTGDSFVASEPITLASPGIPDSPEDFLFFGAVTAAGDVDDDGADDLALGFSRVACTPPACEPEDDEPNVKGAVVLLPGSLAGLTTDGSQLWTQDSAGVVGGPRSDVWGASLAMGRLDAGPTDDLAIGAPFDVTDGVYGAGSVTVLLGSSKGLTTAGAGGAIFHQGTTGIAGSSEEFDQFGRSLTTAYLQSSKQESLIIGSLEGVGKDTQAGQICQLAISSSGPKAQGSRTLNADSSGVSGQAGAYEWFGASLS
jgi:hypothetical protein